MPRPVNPYIAGKPVGNSPAFIGRDDVLRAVLRVLRDPQHHGVVLYGQRRIGKTSILQHLAEWLPREGGPHAIYFDLQDKATWSVGKIAEHLAFAIAAALDLPEPTPGAEPAAWFQKEWLPSVLGKLDEGASLAVLFDELDVLADAKSQRAASATLFGYLRELLASAAPRLGFVFVIGRNLEDLSYLAQPLFKALPAERISLLSQREAEALMRLSEANGSLSWSGEAIAAAWALTHGHPYLLQHLCWQIWQRAHERKDGAPRVGPEHVEESVARSLDASRNALEWLWGGLPSAERVIASALAEAGSGAITQEALYQVLHDSGVRVVIRELRDAPRLLQDWDLIEPADDGYQFRVELLRRWIAQFKPLSRVQQELDHIQPLAENLYQAGVGFYKEGDLERSLEQLRQASRINPNHLGASELLAEILISREEWGEARRLLEALHEIHPTAARPRLIQVLLAEAQRTMDEGEELDLLDRVLALEPKNAVAIAGKQRIWKDAGDRARSEGELEDAMAAYRVAGLPELEASVREEIRATQFVGTVAQIEALEREGDYEPALDMLRRAGELFAGLRDWNADIVRLEQASAMAADYQRATGALRSGERKAASEFLARIIAIDPGYKDTAALLYEVVSGLNVEALRRRYARVTRIVSAGSVIGILAVGGLVLRLSMWPPEKTPADKDKIASLGEAILSAQPSASVLPVASASTNPVKPTDSASPVMVDAGKCPENMAWIPGGKFQMGSNEQANEKPPHSVKVEGFCMDLTEVTVAAYSLCVTQRACTAAGTVPTSYCNSNKTNRQTHPVNCVDRNQANNYCFVRHKRLPTEEEWEYVARAGSEQRRYPWGNLAPWDDSTQSNQLSCWNMYPLTRLGGTCPTGKYSSDKSKWGPYDLAGNVREWTFNFYCSYRDSTDCSREYVIRGSSWEDSGNLPLRASWRSSAPQSLSSYSIGFRCAKSL